MVTYSSLLLKKQFLLSASITEVESKLARYSEDKFEIKKVNRHEYKFVSNSSIGTMVLRFGGSVEGIKTYVLFEPQNNNSVNVTLKTKVRIELILISIIIVVFAISFFLINNKHPQPTWAIIFLPFILIWFWFVYRFQEQKLISKVEDYLLSIQQPAR
jgi:hypothetical protein